MSENMAFVEYPTCYQLDIGNNSRLVLPKGSTKITDEICTYTITQAFHQMLKEREENYEVVYEVLS